MSEYGYRIKNGQIWLVTGDDLVDLKPPTEEQLAAYRDEVLERTPRLEHRHDYGRGGVGPVPPVAPHDPRPLAPC